jgi:hypothetical protein
MYVHARGSRHVWSMANDSPERGGPSSAAMSHRMVREGYIGWDVRAGNVKAAV